MSEGARFTLRFNQPLALGRLESIARMLQAQCDGLPDHFPAVRGFQLLERFPPRLQLRLVPWLRLAVVARHQRGVRSG